MLTQTVIRQRHSCRGPAFSSETERAMVQRAEAAPRLRQVSSAKPPLEKFGRKVWSLPLCTATSFQESSASRAFDIWEIKERISRTIVDHQDKVAFLEAFSIAPRSGPEKVAYGAQTATLVGLPTSHLTPQQIVADPVQLYSKCFSALRAYASSYRWWVGQAPPRPHAASLGLHGELADKFNQALEFIQSYRMIQFERNRGVAIGVTLGLAGVGLCYFAIKVTRTALAEGKYCTDGYAWDDALRTYTKTRPESWYHEPLYFVTDSEGYPYPVYPPSPESIANARASVGIGTGVVLVVIGVGLGYAAYHDGFLHLERCSYRSPSRKISQLIGAS